MSIPPVKSAGRRPGRAAAPAFALLALTALAPAAHAAPAQQPDGAAGAVAAAAPPAANPPAAQPPQTPELPPPPISVVVNGDGVAFPTQPPVQQSGTILVPLRGVFEKLGAGVQYAPDTKTITAVKGDTTVTLRLGDPYAYVNGQPRPLAVVPQALNGVTLVPLRFVSEALGAHVAWKKDVRTVEITTGVAAADQLPTPPGTDPVLGSITGLFPEAGYLTLRVPGGENDRVPLAPGAVLLVKSGDDAPETSAPLSGLKSGDQVTVTRDDQGRGTVVRERTDQRRGPVKSVEPAGDGSAVTLTDGSVVTLAAGAPVTMAGRSIPLGDVSTDETVVIRLDPKTGQGVGVAVVTQDDPNPTPPVKLELASVTLGPGADKTLRAGDTVTVTLTGTPGAKAAFSVVGLDAAQNVPLPETAPGTYSAVWAVPKGASTRAAAVQGTLSRGENTTPPVAAAGTLTIDADPPSVESLDPADGATVTSVRPQVYGTFSDPGSGVDRSSVRVDFDGKDVTPQTQITDGFFQYKPDADLAQGKHTVDLSLKDVAGNETRRSWAFAVGAPSNPIRSFTVTPDDGTALAVGDTLQVRIDAPAGGTATFRVPGIVSGRAMPDQGGGAYIGSYVVKAGDTASHAPVIVTYTPPGGGPPVLDTANVTVSLAGGAPGTPVVDRPQEGLSVGRSVTVSGTARPGTTVRVKITYDGKVVLLPSSGTVLNVDLKTDAEGRWATGDVGLSVPSGVSGASFTLTVVAIGPDGAASAPATVHFKR